MMAMMAQALGALGRARIFVVSVAILGVAADTSLTNSEPPQAKVAIDTTSYSLFAYAHQRVANLPLVPTDEGAGKAKIGPGMILFTASGVAIHQALTSSAFWGAKDEQAKYEEPKHVVAKGPTATPSRAHSEPVEDDDPVHVVLGLVLSLWRRIVFVCLALLLLVAYCVGRQHGRKSRAISADEFAEKDIDLEGKAHKVSVPDKNGAHLWIPQIRGPRGAAFGGGGVGSPNHADPNSPRFHRIATVDSESGYASEAHPNMTRVATIEGEYNIPFNQVHKVHSALGNAPISITANYSRSAVSTISRNNI